jgi:hypothetical protein
MARAARLLAGCTVGIASLALIGWAAGLSALTGFGRGLSTLKPTTAVCFLAVALAASLASRAGTSPRLSRPVLLLPLVALAISAASLIEWVAGADLRLDRWLFPGAVAAAGGAAPGRMGLNTAVAFVLAASAALMLLAGGRRLAGIGQWLALTSGWLALVALVGYLDSAGGAAFRSYTEMSLPTALGFLCQTGSLIGLRTDVAPVAIARSPLAGGAMLRRLLPVVVLAPLVLGGVVAEGARMGLYPPALRFPLLSVLVIAVVAVLVYRIVTRLE